MNVAHSSSGLGYCPLKAETGVRLPYALPRLYRPAEKQIVLASRGRQLRALRVMCFPQRPLDRLLLSQKGLELVGTGLALGTWCKAQDVFDNCDAGKL